MTARGFREGLKAVGVLCLLIIVIGVGMAWPILKLAALIKWLCH